MKQNPSTLLIAFTAILAVFVAAVATLDRWSRPSPSRDDAEHANEERLSRAMTFSPGAER